MIKVRWRKYIQD